VDDVADRHHLGCERERQHRAVGLELAQLDAEVLDERRRGQEVAHRVDARASGVGAHATI
jgi:hypothetical protein